jgi:hypothetical protein
MMSVALVSSPVIAESSAAAAPLFAVVGPLDFVPPPQPEISKHPRAVARTVAVRAELRERNREDRKENIMKISRMSGLGIECEYEGRFNAVIENYELP